MNGISNQSIQKMLDESNSIPKSIEGIKILLVSEGYKDYSDDYKLLFIKALGSTSHTIEVSLEKYNTKQRKNKKYQESFSRSEKNTESVKNTRKKSSFWNWEAAFFAPWYFAKHGRWIVGLLLAFFAGSLIPIFMIIVFLFSGIFANKLLDSEISPNANSYLLYVTILFGLVMYSQLRMLM